MGSFVQYTFSLAESNDKKIQHFIQSNMFSTSIFNSVRS